MSDVGVAPADSTPDPPPAEGSGPPPLENAAQLAGDILAHHFGSRPAELTPETSGASNQVFTAHHRQGTFVIRLSPDAERMRAYEKECWAIERARGAGVPTPTVIVAGGDAAPHPYMIQQRVDGVEATGHRRRLEILRELGACAARINGIVTTGFGDVFDWAPADVPRNRSWRAFLFDELRIAEKLEVLGAHDMLPAPQLDGIREALEALGDEERHATLNHGDLRLKNVMVDDAGAIVAVLDWEKCISGPAPEWELSLALHDLSVDEKEEFARGYGVSPEELARLAPVLKALNLVNYAPVIQQAADAGDEDQMARLRLRLGGGLDLFSF